MRSNCGLSIEACTNFFVDFNDGKGWGILKFLLLPVIVPVAVKLPLSKKLNLSAPAL